MEQSDCAVTAMKIGVLENDAAVAERGASIIAEAAREDAAARGRFAFAVSGGRTPWAMLSFLAAKQVPWTYVRIFQVDERVAPMGDRDRNLTHLDASFSDLAPIWREQVHAMPVEALNLATAAESYSPLCGNSRECRLHSISPRPRPRWTPGFACAQRSRPRSRKPLRERHRHVPPSSSTNDAHVPGARPCPSRPGSSGAKTWLRSFASAWRLSAPRRH